MRIKLAIISDLHCHPKGDPEVSETVFHSDGLRVPRNDHPIEALKSLLNKESITADVLVTPGDFTNRANIHGYNVSVLTVRDLASTLKVDKVVATLGNHDIDSRNIHKQGFDYLARNIFADFPILDKNERASYFSDGVCVTETATAAFLIVNSVHAHRDPDSAKRGLITTAQQEAIELAIEKLATDKLRICVTHHHPLPHEMLNLGAADLLEGGDMLLDSLEKSSFDLLVHGHKHHPRLRYTTGGAAALPVFSSGSLSAVLSDKVARSCRNTFHILELSKEPGSKATGEITTWEFSAHDGWVPASHISAGINGLCGFGAGHQLADIASSVANCFDQKNTIPWDELIHSDPRLRYLIPSEMDELGRKLAQIGLLIKPHFRSPYSVGKTVKI
jgi:predicted phosphodiesterase